VVTVCQPILICSKAAKLFTCAIAMARVQGGILTSEEVPGEQLLAEFMQKREWRGQMKLKLKIGYFV
jgi:hypothetical protein